MLHFFFITVQKRLFIQIEWNTTPFQHRYTLILKLCSSRMHTHEWYCISSASKFETKKTKEKKKKEKKDQPTDPPVFWAKRANKHLIFFTRPYIWGIMVKWGQSGLRWKLVFWHILKAYEILFPMPFVSYHWDIWFSWLILWFILHISVDTWKINLWKTNTTNKVVLKPQVSPAFLITYFCNHCNITFMN